MNTYEINMTENTYTPSEIVLHNERSAQRRSKPRELEYALVSKKNQPFQDFSEIHGQPRTLSNRLSRACTTSRLLTSLWPKAEKPDYARNPENQKEPGERVPVVEWIRNPSVEATFHQR